MNLPLISEIDYFRLTTLLNSDLIDKNEKTIQDLRNELERAEVLEVDEVPQNLITMNTRFYYLHVEDNKICEMTIVYPQLTDLSKRWISITAPLGAAFIGFQVGDEFEWEFPDGKMKKLRILRIAYQPEYFGDFHL